MPTFSITDNKGNAVAFPVSWTNVSGLYKYLRSEALHLIVLPDFVSQQDETIAHVKPQPLTAQLKLGDKFQLGNTKPEINIAGTADVSLKVTALPGTDLFDSDAFAIPAMVPPEVGYVGLTFDGSLSLGVTGSSGDLTFGLNNSKDITLGYWRSFPTVGASQPTLGAALAATIASYVIPGDLSDIGGLQINDVCAVSGSGSLKLSGAVKISATPNPLASVELPLKAGSVNVQEGAMAGLSSSFTITGGYQMRLRRLSASTVELSFLQQKGTKFTLDLTASAGIAVKEGDTDLIAKLLGAIDPKTDNTALLKAGLSKEEAGVLSDAIKGAIDHSLQASFDEALSLTTDTEAAFQYHIDVAVARADIRANDAVHRALEGDLSLLTALEAGMAADGTVAPGVRMISSVFSRFTKKEASFKVNLLGLLNVLSLSDLVVGSKIIRDPVTGDVTIVDSVTGSQIEAIVEPLKRDERLRKAIFDSLLVTASYKASGALEANALASSSFHFALTSNTNSVVLKHYLNWLVPLGLSSPLQQQALFNQIISRGFSTCLLRTAFDDAQCRSMFYDAGGNLYQEDRYLDYGRRAMMALLGEKLNPYDSDRYDLLANHWKEAFDTGPSPALASVVGLTGANPNADAILSLLIGDVYDIAWWASSMVDAGKALRDMQHFLGGRSPASLRNDHAFELQRVSLQNAMAKVVSNSKARFDEPWGMVCLFWAAGSRGASAKIVTPRSAVTRP